MASHQLYFSLTTCINTLKARGKFSCNVQRNDDNRKTLQVQREGRGGGGGGGGAHVGNFSSQVATLTRYKSPASRGRPRLAR